MSMQYVLPNSNINTGFGIEIMSLEDLMADDKAKEDFWQLFSKLTNEEVAFHHAVGLTLNGGYTKEALLSYCKDHEQVFFVTDDNNRRIGCCEIRYDRKFDTHRVCCVYIDSKYRGRGLGKLLMQEVIREYEGKDLSLNVSAGNPIAMKLYASLGFTVTDHVMLYKNKK